MLLYPITSYVIGLENTITSPEDATEEFLHNDRIRLSNPIWTRIINETIEPNKLNIVSVGSSHNFTFGEKIGLKDLLIDYGKKLMNLMKL